MYVQYKKIKNLQRLTCRFICIAFSLKWRHTQKLITIVTQKQVFGLNNNMGQVSHLGPSCLLGVRLYHKCRTSFLEKTH